MRREFEIPQIDRSKVDKVSQLIETISNNFGNKDSKSLIEELNSLCDKQFEEDEFLEFWSWISLENYTEKCLLPPPPKVENLSKEDITYLVDIIYNVKATENIVDYYIELLEKSLNTDVSYLFYDLDLSQSEIVEELSKKDFKMYHCPCCGYKTFYRPISHCWGDICPVCYWEVDPLTKDDNSPSCANHGLSLNQARENFKSFGACEKSMTEYVREPHDYEL